jgi:aminoglycoside phosphotransferase (APT) family kinase protein
VSAEWNPTAPPRAGEELPADRLIDYLRRNLPEVRGEIEVEQFPAGHSNLTYLVRVNGAEFVLRRPPFGTRVKGAHDMGREFHVLSKLHSSYPLAPKPVLFCDDPAVLGSPFYLMHRMKGLVIRRQLIAPLAGYSGACRALSQAMVDNLVRLHAVDLDAAGLREFGKPEGYVRRQIEGWTRRWADAQTDPLQEMDDISHWLHARMPPESGAAMIHNDYKLDNLLLDPVHPSTITGVLDWEMATVGDPLMDLGTALSYWVECSDPPEFLACAISPTANPGFLTRLEVVQRYEEQSGRAVVNPDYYYVYGLFKLAVILQQIYFRFVNGLTLDERFARLGVTIAGLARQAVRSIS